MGFAIAGATLAGAYLSSQASNNAASQEAGASDQAAQLQYQEYQQQLANEQPWLQAGQQGLQQLEGQMGSLTSPFTMQDFQNSDPGYQFQLQQGLQAIQNSNAARGLGGIGSANSMDMANYAEGLANTDYNQAFQNYETQQNNTYNKLAGLAGIGQTATAQTNSAAQNAGNNLSSIAQSAGNAQAANSIAQGNIANGGITNAANGYMNYSMMNSLLNKNGGGSTGPNYANLSSLGTSGAGAGVYGGQSAGNGGSNYLGEYQF